MGLIAGSLVVVIAAAWQAPATIDRIVAIVNGELITLSDVRAARVLRFVPADADERAIVGTLVERRLVLTEMRRFQTVEPSPEALSARRAEWERRVDAADLDALLTQAGVDAAFLDRWMADDLRREGYLRQRFAALEGARRDEAIRLWIAGLLIRANIVYREQR